MLDGFSLDQLRIFVAAADEASFSAAGRKLGRTQSVISQSIANLEARLGVPLFERTGRYPRLAPEGRSLLATARNIVRDVDHLKARARDLAGGLEPELSIVVDVMFPQDVLTGAVSAFAAAFPETPLNLHVEALGAVAEMVLGRRASVGVMGSLPILPPSLESERLLGVPIVTVVAPGSPLAALRRPITREDVAAHTQLVLTDRSTLTEGRDFGVVGSQTWRLADLGAKHAFLRAGLGWGHMPLPLVASDLEQGMLVAIEIEGMTPRGTIMPMHAVYRADALPGIAGRWLIDRLRDGGSA
jgi:DNA-binding transcriptional LysR family regulator